MRLRALLFAGSLGLVGSGCFSPFSWPDERKTQEPEIAIEKTIEAKLVARPLEIPNDDALGRAAACMEQGDDRGAAIHLKEHVRLHPEAIMIRAHLAELLYRLGERTAARGEFTSVVAQAQTGAIPKHLVHCHTRLMEIAGIEHEPAEEELHRGIGLYLLVKRWDEETPDQEMAEKTLRKALTSLESARKIAPRSARIHFYLGETYRRLGQEAAAQDSYKTAERSLPDWSLTSDEKRQLLERRADAITRPPV